VFPQTKKGFLLVYESMETHNGHEIDVIAGHTAKNVFLKRLGGTGADPRKAATLQLIGAPNSFLQMEQEEDKCL
jgi:hypothetical protein